MPEIEDILSFYVDQISFAEEDLDKSIFDSSLPRVVEWKNQNITKSNGRFVQGYASTADVDSDGEVMVQNGLDISYFCNQGWFNWLHNNSASHVVGFPAYAKIDSKGFFTKGMLLNTKMADEVWDLATNLHNLGNPRNLGFSVEGKVEKRSEINKSKIIKAKITNVAITHIPVNTKATFEIVTKSFVPEAYDSVMKCIIKDTQLAKDLGGMAPVGLVAGNSFGSSNYSGGESLRVESLDAGVKNQVQSSLSELEERLTRNYKKKKVSKSEMASVLKSVVAVDAPDILIDKVVDLIFMAGGPEEFKKIMSESNLF